MSASEKLRVLGVEFQHVEVEGQPETFRTYNVSLAAAMRAGQVLPQIVAVVEAALQVTTAASAVENGGRGVSKAETHRLLMVKAEGEMLLEEALAALDEALT